MKWIAPLLTIKSQVSSLKPVFVPKLKFSTFVSSTKIRAFLQKELKYCNVPEFFWTASKVVLGYNSNGARRFHTFVANTVQATRDHFSPDHWNLVDAKDSPADDTSRGLGKIYLNHQMVERTKFLAEATARKVRLGNPTFS